MLLTDVRDEFTFNCQCRKLSPKTVRNYTKQINYLLRFLEQEKEIMQPENVKTRNIKEFLLKMTKAGRSANYVNDLLKAYKVFFRYAYDEGCTEENLTKRIANSRVPE